jgi:pantetheine-phosphate adenylyltransferase
MGKKRIAIYPGSFDPITCGHVDIIVRGSTIFDEVIVAVLENIDKKALFSVDERLDMIRAAFSDRPNVIADAFTGLLVDYAQSKGATAIVRGVRAISDFEYEFQMALMNRRLAPAIETVFMMPAEEYSYVSSRLIKEVAILGGSVKGLVPAGVEKNLSDKLKS